MTFVKARTVLFSIMFVCTFSFSLLRSCAAQEPPPSPAPVVEPSPESRLPNILLIVADDMGYSDCGCFGGEIDTPSIDAIAASGVRFTNFFVNPMCTVTRTSLLTGHEHSQSNQYKRSVPIAKMLHIAGYRSSISGKWHQPGNPLDAGFDSFYGFLKGEINGWLGTYSNNRTLAIGRDRAKPEAVETGWYCSDAFTDDAMDQMKKAIAEDKPFFAYLPFNAPHGPLHAPKTNTLKYQGRFSEGWDVLRNNRMQRMNEMGIIDAQYRSSPPHAEAGRWNELAPETKAIEARRFTAYAAMVDRMDENIGRVLTFLDDQNIADNTIVIFFSDNGGNYSHGAIKDFAKESPFKPLSPRPACATGWARLMNTPFSWYKTSSFRGGVSSPLIIRWPKIKSIHPGSILRHRLHVSDIYPTLLEVVKQQYPPDPALLPKPKKPKPNDGKSPKAKKLDAPAPKSPQPSPVEPRIVLPPKPLYGKSFFPILENASLSNDAIRDEIFWGFEGITKGLLKGDWKIASINDSPWKLYNIGIDPAESTDLASQYPMIVNRLHNRWYEFAHLETDMPEDWRLPLNPTWQGWGLHRMRLTMPLETIYPACSQINVELRPTLCMTFTKPINFCDTHKKTLRLFELGKPGVPVWEFDPDNSHPAQCKKTVTFELPKLKPATTYYLLTAHGWAWFDEKKALGLNDGAYFYRFRTRAD